MKTKLYFLLILFSFLVNLCFSQIYRGEEANKLIQHTDIIRFKDYSRVPSYFRFSENVTRSEQEAIEIIKSFILNSNFDLQLRKIQHQGNGAQTHRYYQTVHGFPIEFTALNLQVKDGKVTEVNGDILDNPEINPSFHISEAEALQYALAFVNAEQYMWEDDDAYYPNAEKVIVPDKIVFENSVLKAAYKFEVNSKMPYNRQMIYVDAENGDIILDLSLIHFSNVSGTAQTAYYGERPIDMSYNGSQYILYDNSRGNGIRTYNCNNGLYHDATDFFENTTSWENTPYGTDAHYATIQYYDYLLEKHGYNSIDNAGFALNSYVHFNLRQYGFPDNVNAFWNGESMTYGDGDPERGITPLTTMDIVGHEITHGLTKFTAGLISDYLLESGALNEGFSDIFGVALEFFAIPEYVNWLMGDAMGLIIRDIKNPKSMGDPSTYKGSFWDIGYRGTVLAYWFYLVTEGGSGTNDFGNSYNVPGIGISKAEQIAFKLLTEYLLPTSGYADACFYGLQIVEILFGANSAEEITVGEAFYAIGLIDEPYNPLFPSFNADVTNSCNGIIHFRDRSAGTSDSWLWDFGDGRTSTLQHPVHQYHENGEYTVTLTVVNEEGERSLVKTDYIIIENMGELADHQFKVPVKEPFELHIPNAGENLKWYTNIDGNLFESTPVFTGNIIQHSAILENQTYYILDSFIGEEYRVGETSCNAAGSFSNASFRYYLVFDAYQSFHLKSVLVNANSAGSRQIMLMDASQNFIWTTDVYIPVGISRISIDKIVPEGVNLQLACQANSQLYRLGASANLNYPYKIDDIVSIKCSGSSIDAHSDKSYNFFYDWEIKLLDCNSELAKVTISIENSVTEQNITIFPNPTTGELKIESGGLTIKSIEIFDIYGRKIQFYQQIISSTNHLINISHLSEGVYFVRVEDKIFKVVKN